MSSLRRNADGALLALLVATLPLESVARYFPLHQAPWKWVAAVAVAFTGIRCIRAHRLPRLPGTGAALALAVYVAASALSVAVTHDRGALAALVPVCLLPVLLLVALELGAGHAARAWAVAGFLGSVCVVAVIALSQYAFVALRAGAGVGGGRLAATFDDPDILARFLSMGLLAGVFLVGRRPAVVPARLAAAVAVLAAAAEPTSLSRFGLVLMLLSAAMGLAPRGRRRARLALVLLCLILFSGFVAIRPDLRGRAANLASVLTGTAANVVVGPPPEYPWGNHAPYQTVKSCDLYSAWQTAYDPTALAGNAARLPADAAPYAFAYFGRPETLPAGRLTLWVRMRALDQHGHKPELHLGMWEEETSSWVQGAYIDADPSGYSPYYGWFNVGSFSGVPGHHYQPRIQSLREPSTDWYVDQFALTAKGSPPAPEPAWGPAKPAAVAMPGAVSGGFELTPARFGAPFKSEAAHPALAAPGSARFTTAKPVPPGKYQVWMQGRVEGAGPAAHLANGVVAAGTADYVAGGWSDNSPAALCGWVSTVHVGALALSESQTVTFQSTAYAGDPATWVVYDYVLVPDVANMAATGTGVREPAWAAFADRLPLDDQRRYLIKAGVAMFLDHPLAGVGFGRFREEMSGPYAGFILPGYHDVLSHNSVVTVAAEQGLVGLLLLLAIVVVTWRELRWSVRRSAHPDEVRLFALLLLPIAVDSLLEGRLFTEPYAWLAMGLALAAARERDPHRPMRVGILTHYYPPEVGAPQGRLHEMAMHLVRAGTPVTVVTGFPNYPTGRLHPEYRLRVRSRERIDGVDVVRTWVLPAPNRGFALRLANHASFAISAFLAARQLRQADVLFVESPPLFLGVTGRLLAGYLGIPYVFNVSDIWPQSAVEMGALRGRFLIGLAEALEAWLYRGASKVTVVTSSIRDELAARGMPDGKLAVLTNGVDADSYRPRSADPELAGRLGIEVGAVAMYAGTHGLAQGLEVILDAAALDGRARYVLVGEGAAKDALRESARASGLDRLTFVGNQSRALMPEVLCLADVVVVPLRKLDVFKGALPSKMFEAMAAGKPLVVAVWGEAAELVRTADCGVVVEPEDAQALAQAVERLLDDPEERKRLGDNGRRYAVEHFSRQALAARFLRILTDARDDAERV